MHFLSFAHLSEVWISPGYINGPINKLNYFASYAKLISIENSTVYICRINARLLHNISIANKAIIILTFYHGTLF